MPSSVKRIGWKKLATEISQQYSSDTLIPSMLLRASSSIISGPVGMMLSNMPVIYSTCSHHMKLSGTYLSIDVQIPIALHQHWRLRWNGLRMGSQCDGSLVFSAK